MASVTFAFKASGGLTEMKARGGDDLTILRTTVWPLFAVASQSLCLRLHLKSILIFFFLFFFLKFFELCLVTEKAKEKNESEQSKGKLVIFFSAHIFTPHLSPFQTD